MTQRDRKILIIIGVVVLGYIVYVYPFEWYQDSVASAQRQRFNDFKTLKDFQVQAASQPALDTEWKGYVERGLEERPEVADAEAEGKIEDFASRYNLVVEKKVHPSSAAGRSEFQELQCSATISGNAADTAYFLLALEQSKSPIMRLDSVGIHSKKDGVDDLNTDIVVTTLVHTPTAKASTRGAGTRGGTTGRGAVAAGSTSAPSIDVAEIERILKERREKELTMPAPKPLPPTTDPDEIERILRERREEQMGGGAASQPAATNR